MLIAFVILMVIILVGMGLRQFAEGLVQGPLDRRTEALR
jgi:hypothetical protein